jgi:hypothetical protein
MDEKCIHNLLENVKGTENLEYLVVDGRIIPKSATEKWGKECRLD